MLKYFPLSEQAKQDLVHCLVVVIAYAVIAWLIGFVGGLFSVLPVVRTIVGIICWAVRVYCACGALVAILVFLKVIK